MGQGQLRDGVLYLRKSKGRAGISRQRTTGRAKAAELGVAIIAEYVDVDATAYQQVGGPRPKRDGFADMLAHLRSTESDNPLTVIAWHADRLVRGDADTADLIEVCARCQHPVETVRGGAYQLWTATGRKRLRGDAVDAAYEVDHLTERINEFKAEEAAAGRWGGGVRPFGFEADGVTVRKAEAREIAAGTEALLAGVSVVASVRDLNRRGVVAAGGGAWGTTQWRRVLLRPRNAGLLVWRGEIVGHAEWGRWMDDDKTIWGCIVGEDRWRALQRLLTDPARTLTPGPERRHLGSGLYRCGICGETVVTSLAGNSQTRWRSYRCRGGSPEPARGRHVARRVDVVDEYVVGVLLRFLARPGTAALFAARPESQRRERAELQRKTAWLRERLDEQAELHAQGVIDGQQLKAGSVRLRGELDGVQARLDRFAEVDVLGGLVGSPDVADVWATLPLSRQRAVLDAVMTVTILPAAQKGRQANGTYFDPDSVRIEWKV